MVRGHYGIRCDRRLRCLLIGESLRAPCPDAFSSRSSFSKRFLQPLPFPETTMEFPALLTFFAGAWVDDALVWIVAAVAGTVGLVALVNALDMFLDTVAG
jgi:hypothetical protein